MSRIKVTRGRKQKRDKAAIARVATAWRQREEVGRNSSTGCVLWGLLVGMSSLALGLYHPAMAQDEPGRDRQPAPRELGRGLGPWNTFPPVKPELNPLDRPLLPEERRYHTRGAVGLMVQQEMDGPPKQHFEIPAGALGPALAVFSRQTDLQLLYLSELIEGRTTQGVQGDYTPEDGLKTLLSGTGLQYQFSDSKTVVLQPAGPSGAAKLDQSSANLADQPKPIKVPEVVVKDARERPTWTTPVDGYKVDHVSTVTRSTMSTDEAPTSIGVVTRDLIRDTFARTQNDALEHVSGVSRSNTLLGRGEGIAIRGFVVNTFNGSLNGLKANGLPTDGVFAPDWGIVERYEIVKGPASIVGGAANPGGIINRITKTPQRSNFTTVETNIGSYGLYRGLIDANGVMPKHEHIRGRLVFAVEEGGNFVDNTPVRQYTVAPSVEFDLFRGAGKLLLVGTYQHFDGASYPGWPLTTDGNMLNVPRTRNFGGGAPNGARTQYTGYNGEVHYNHQFIHDIKLSIKGKYSKSDLSDKNIYAYTFGGLPPSGDTLVSSSLRQNRFDTYAGELVLSKEFDLLGKKHEILAGADHRDMTNNFLLGYAYLPVGQAPILDSVFNPRNVFRAPSDSFLVTQASGPFRVDLKQTGAFGQAIFRPFERLTLVFAGRHDRAESQRLLKESGELFDQTKSGWTGRAGATVKMTSWMNIYAGLQQSFQPQPFSLTRDNQMLEPETGINYEVGAKLNLLDERLRLSTALFRTYRRDVATVDPTDIRFTVAIGEQRHQGVEFDVNGQPIPGLNLSANITYLDAKITEDNDLTRIGSRPVRVPRSYFGQVFATYQLQSGPLQGFGFGGGVYFQDGFEVGLPNQFRTNGYQRVDAMLFYRGNKRYDVTINIRNLLNEKYIEFPNLIHGQNIFGAPITAVGSVRVFF
ncbi:MAG: TonB-dependent receptor [Nitrospira sp.]|nr:TonB-dependent receptor [Nitrospira sp.]